MKLVVSVHCRTRREMAAKLWTPEEQLLLRSLHLDPIRTDREKLTALVGHFQKGGGVWAVSEGGTGPVLVSRGLARKVRDLVRDHKLDWLLTTGANLVDISEGYSPRLRILSPSVDIWTDGVGIARYATVEVAAVFKVEARDCWAWVDILLRGLSLPLHWSGTPYTAEEASAPRVIINPAKPVRLDVVVALPAPGEAVGNFPNAMVSGEVASSLPSSRYGKQTWNGAGCWLAQPLALYNPAPNLESYLPPGEYRIKVRVGCDSGEEDSREFILRSPISWEELTLMLLT